MIYRILFFCLIIPFSCYSASRTFYAEVTNANYKVVFLNDLDTVDEYRDSIVLRVFSSSTGYQNELKEALFMKNCIYGLILESDTTDSLSKIIQYFDKIEFLSLCSPNITELPNWVKRLQSLIFIEFGYRDINKGSFARDYGCERLAKIDNLSYLINLRTLILNNCNIIDLNIDFSQLKKLEYFSADGCGMKKITSKLPESLIMLSVNRNRLQELKIDKNLSYCYAYMNEIERVGFDDVAYNLKELHLAWNRIKEIKLEPIYFKSLTSLDLEYNQFIECPISIWEIGSLQHLSITFCKFDGALNYLQNTKIERVIVSVGDQTKRMLNDELNKEKNKNIEIHIGPSDYCD
jgi:Leucine-rich repeat (LRR) protein